MNRYDFLTFSWISSAVMCPELEAMAERIITRWGVSLYPALLRESRRSSALVNCYAPGRECLSLPHLKEVKGLLFLPEDNVKGGTCETFSRSLIERPLRNP